NSDTIFLFFTALLALNYLSNTENNAADYVKFISYFGFYIIGRTLIFQSQHSTVLGYFSLAGLSALVSLALSGSSYVTWGSIETFTGGYFFKTDLALSALIFLTFSFATLKNKALLFISLIFAAYLVFKSNARIALPLIFALPVFIILSRGKSAQNILTPRKALGIFSAAALGMALFTFVDFRSMGMLGFDFSDPFSAANTQGRSVIWSALLEAYGKASLFEQAFGMGLTADAKATAIFSGSPFLEGTRAHNSYLYLLVCTGLIGSLIFYYLIYSIYSKCYYNFKKETSDRITTISSSLLIIFLWMSMTTEIIIRPQLMILLFFFSGLHVQQYLKIRKKEFKERDENPACT
ncbi:MAG: hypothetical protein EKK55_21915, partial [Rhodocyclaceae bacterium]